MSAVNSTSRLLLVAPLGLFLGCSGDTTGTTPSEVGGNSNVTSGGSVSTGGVISTGGVATGGTIASATGGTIANATGGTIATATGGTRNATGGTVANATGGTVASATGGTIASATGGTIASATGGTIASATGGTTAAGGTTGKATGGTTASATGGTKTSGGTGSNTGGTTGTAGSTSGYPIGNPAVPSTGCGKALPSTYKAGANTTRKDMTSAGLSREYIINIPTGYDSSKPYRLVFAWHCMGSSDTGAVNSGYYGGKTQDTGKTTIFVAPQGYTDSMPWRSDDKDHIFFDDMLKLFKSDLCIDESRVFTIGFSFGGMA